MMNSPGGAQNDSLSTPPGQRVSLGSIPPRVLVVEDDSDVRQALVEMLEGRGYDILEAANGREALELLDADGDLDLVLLDMQIPEPDGYEVLRRLNAEPSSRDVPVICVSARARLEDRVAGLKLGAADFVAKPFDSQELVARMGRTLRVKRTLDRLHRAKAAAEQLSLTDPVTGLPNRRALDDRLGQEIDRARRHVHNLGCLMIDVDRFKDINDRLGHATGDEVLRQVARALRTGLRSFDFVARYGGDEFVALLPGADKQGAKTAAEGLRQLVLSLEVPIEGGSGDELLPPTISIGIASYDGSVDETGSTLLERADEALLRAKRCGRNRVITHA